MITMLSVAWCGMLAFGATIIFDMPPARTFPRPVPPVFTIPDHMKDWPLVSAEVEWVEDELDTEDDIIFSENGGIYLLEEKEVGAVEDITLPNEPAIPGEEPTGAVSVKLPDTVYLNGGKWFEPKAEITINTDTLFADFTDGKSNYYGRKTMQPVPETKDNDDWIFSAYEIPADLRPQPITTTKVVWHGKPGTKFEGKAWENSLVAADSTMT